MKLTRVQKWLAIAVGFSGAAVGLIGFAHTPAGRGLLAYLPSVGECPLGSAAKLSPEARERARQDALVGFAGERPAASRAVLGFDLGQSTRSEVDVWAARNDLACKADQQGTALRCRDVPASTLPGATRDVDDLLLTFDATHRLVAIDAARSGLSADEAATLLRERRNRLEADNGPASEISPDLSAAYLAGARLRQAGAEFNFSDYRAEVEALNVGDYVRVREFYQAIDGAS